MNINELREWAKDNDVANRIISSFKKLLKNYELEDNIEYDQIMKGIDVNNLRYNVHTVSLNLSNWPECSYNTVSVSMRVFFKEKQIANYSVFYLFSGEAEDDLFEFL